MVEILAVIGAVALFLFVRMFFRFSGFRKRLIHAFEAHGLPSSWANNVYTLYCEEMNDMHINQGMTPEQIALHFVMRFKGASEMREEGQLD